MIEHLPNVGLVLDDEKASHPVEGDTLRRGPPGDERVAVVSSPQWKKLTFDLKEMFVTGSGRVRNLLI